RLTRLQFEDKVLKFAFLGSILAVLGILGLVLFGPRTLRPTMILLGIIVSLMGMGALYSSRRIWLGISLINNLALLIFFKYARFAAENLNALLAWLHAPFKL